MVRWRYCVVLAMLLLLPAKTGSKLDDEEEQDIHWQMWRSQEVNDEYDDDDDDDDEEEYETTAAAHKRKKVTVVRRPLKIVTTVTVVRRPPKIATRAKQHAIKAKQHAITARQRAITAKQRAITANQRAITAKQHAITAITAITVKTTTKKKPLKCYVCAFTRLIAMPLRECLEPTKNRVHTITCHSAEDKCFTSVISKNSPYEAVVRGCHFGCIESPETTCCELNRCNNQTIAMSVIAPRSLTTSNKSYNTIPPTVLRNRTVGSSDWSK